jgi:tetratricopeptide (TPR) repeat protein
VNSIEANRDLAIIYGYSSIVFSDAGEKGSALQNMQKARSIFETLAARDPENTQAQRDLLLCYQKMGDLLSKVHDLAGALDTCRKALSISENHSARDPASAVYRRDLAGSYFDTGEILSALASDSKVPAAARREKSQQARSFYQKYMDAWLQMRKRGEFQKVAQAVIDQATIAIVKCDKALTELAHR